MASDDCKITKDFGRTRAIVNLIRFIPAIQYPVFEPNIDLTTPTQCWIVLRPFAYFVFLLGSMPTFLFGIFVRHCSRPVLLGMS
jgi:hypothetical protein